MISPTYDELHDRVTEDALVLELMELLRECEAFLKEPVPCEYCITSLPQSQTGCRCPGCRWRTQKAELLAEIERLK